MFLCILIISVTFTESVNMQGPGRCRWQWRWCQAYSWQGLGKLYKFSVLKYSAQEGAYKLQHHYPCPSIYGYKVEKGKKKEEKEEEKKKGKKSDTDKKEPWRLLSLLASLQLRRKHTSRYNLSSSGSRDESRWLGHLTCRGAWLSRLVPQRC